MDWKLLLLVVSTLIIFVVFCQTLQQGCSANLEGFDDSEDVEMVIKKDMICKSSYEDVKNLPLREYLIKASFNTAYNGVDISSNTIERRLAEGYRFLDFNVYCASGGIVYVGYSDENAPTTGFTLLTLEDALDCVVKSAFTKPKKPIKPRFFMFNDELDEEDGDVGPNLRDNCIDYPVWIHIRVYRPPDSETDVVAKVADIINNAQVPGNYMLRQNGMVPAQPIQITGCTTLSEIGSNRIIFSMDIENVKQVYQPSDTLSAEYVPVATRQAMRSFVNVLTGGSTIPAFYKYTDDTMLNKTMKLGITDSKKLKTNVKYMYVAYPHPNDTKENPDSTTLISNRSIQLIPVRAYLDDYNLSTYSEMFDYFKTPFVPLSYVYTRLNSSE